MLCVLSLRITKERSRYPHCSSSAGSKEAIVVLLVLILPYASSPSAPIHLIIQNNPTQNEEAKPRTNPCCNTTGVYRDEPQSSFILLVNHSRAVL